MLIYFILRFAIRFDFISILSSKICAKTLWTRVKNARKILESFSWEAQLDFRPEEDV